MSSHFKNFNDLLQHLKKLKLRKCYLREKKSNQYVLLSKTLVAELNNIYNNPSVFALITSAEELYQVFKEFPSYAIKLLTTKKSLITRLCDLIEFKEAYQLLPMEFMLSKADQVDIQDDVELQVISYQYPFLVEPLMMREENRAKINSINAFLRVIECESYLGPMLLVNESLRNQIQQFSDLSLILSKSPESSCVLFQDERICQLIDLPHKLMGLIKLNSHIAVEAFKQESFRYMVQTPQEKFELLCALCDEDIISVLDLFYGESQLTVEVFNKFEEIAARIQTDRSEAVLLLIQGCVGPITNSNALSCSLIESVQVQAELIRRVGLLSSCSQDAESKNADPDVFFQPKATI